MKIGDVITKVVELVTAPFEPLADALNNFIKDFANTLKEGILMIIKHLEVEAKPDLDKIIPPEFMEIPYYKDLKKYVEENAGKKPIPLGAIGAMLGGSIIGTGVGMGLGGFGRDLTNWFNSWRRPTPLDLPVLAYAKHTGKLSEDVINKNYASLGYSDDYKDLLFAYYKPHLTVSEIIEGERRLGEDKVKADERLKEIGYNDDDISILKELSWYYPSPTDFIRFAVREVFTEDKETQEALSAEFPEDIVEYAKKAGMSKDVLMWYWMSHWELPSPTQVYEMLHRLHPDVLKVRGKAYEEMGLEVDKLKTDLETVKFYLKQADYDKRWRERLLAISYSPLTRVDLRRIYELGLIDDEELIARLMEIGYTKADALKLLEFYKTYKVSEEKDLTRSQILELFKIKEITEEECKEMLMSIGYDEVEAEFLIAIEKYKESEREINDKVAVYTYQFEEGMLTEKELVEKLDELGLRASRRDKIVAEAVRRRNRKVRLPSKEDIVKWYKNKQITEERARELLTRINIPTEFHDLYLGKKEK